MAWQADRLPRDNSQKEVALFSYLLFSQALT